MRGAGKLDRRVQFRRYTESDDGFQMVKGWADHGTPVSFAIYGIKELGRNNRLEITAGAEVDNDSG